MGSQIFDKTLQKTNEGINELTTELGFRDENEAYLIFKAVLQSLRDRFTIEEEANFGAQLPMLVKGFYYENWNPSKPL